MIRIYYFRKIIINQLYKYLIQHPKKALLNSLELQLWFRPTKS